MPIPFDSEWMVLRGGERGKLVLATPWRVSASLRYAVASPGVAALCRGESNVRLREASP